MADLATQYGIGASLGMVSSFIDNQYKNKQYEVAMQNVARKNAALQINTNQAAQDAATRLQNTKDAAVAADVAAQMSERQREGQIAVATAGTGSRSSGATRAQLTSELATGTQREDISSTVDEAQSNYTETVTALNRNLDSAWDEGWEGPNELSQLLNIGFGGLSGLNLFGS